MPPPVQPFSLYHTLDDYIHYSDDEDEPDPDRVALAAAIVQPHPLTPDHVATLASLASGCGGDALYVPLPPDHPPVPYNDRAALAAQHFHIPPGTWYAMFDRPAPNIHHCGRCAAEGLPPPSDIETDEIHFTDIQIGFHRFVGLFLDG
jgi:hypothetical protein